VAATSSSRFVKPNYWLDTTSGTCYQVQARSRNLSLRWKSIGDIGKIYGNEGGGIDGPAVGDVRK